LPRTHERCGGRSPINFDPSDLNLLAFSTRPKLTCSPI
jgi:hypothetical protein